MPTCHQINLLRRCVVDREYTVRVGAVETRLTLRRIGAASWLAQATRTDGVVIEVTGDDADYVVERVRLALNKSGDAISAA